MDCYYRKLTAKTDLTNRKKLTERLVLSPKASVDDQTEQKNYFQGQELTTALYLLLEINGKLILILLLENRVSCSSNSL